MLRGAIRAQGEDLPANIQNEPNLLVLPSKATPKQTLATSVARGGVGLASVRHRAHQFCRFTDPSLHCTPPTFCPASTAHHGTEEFGQQQPSGLTLEFAQKSNPLRKAPMNMRELRKI